MQLYIQSASFLALALLHFSPTLILSRSISLLSLTYVLSIFALSCTLLFLSLILSSSFARSNSYTLFSPHQRTITKPWTDSKREKTQKKNTANQQLTKSVTFHLNNTYKMNEKIFRYLHFLNQ